MKVVINKCYGGFGLSHKAVMKYAELKGIKLYCWLDDTYKKVYKDRANLYESNAIIHYATVSRKKYEEIAKEEKEKQISSNRFEKSDKVYFSTYDIDRSDKDLIKTIEELEEEANGNLSELKIVEIPDDIEYEIQEYDGIEWIAEKHRTWR